MTTDYVDTYYSRTLHDTIARAPLDADLDADVCVVGAGMAGITAALELLRRGRSVVLLDANRVSWGASGRNGGVVSPGYSTGIAQIVRHVGMDRAKALYRMSIEGVDIVADNIRQLGIDAAEPVPGVLRLSRHDNGNEMIEQQRWLAREFDYGVEHLPTQAVREMLVSDKYHQGLLDRRAFHFHPLNYARALVAEIERLGGRVFEDSEVVSIADRGATKRVATARGSVTARDVVLTCGGYTGRLVPKLARSYLPITTYMMLTEPAADLIASAIRTRASIGDSRRASDYYRLVDDGRRVLWGGMITTRRSDPRRLADALRDRMVDAYPQLAPLAIQVAWSGKMAYARHLMPLIGRFDDGIWYCMGFGGHGMNTTAIGGRVIAEGVAGASDRYRRFEAFGLPWNGGYAGLAVAQLTYWRYQVMDFMRERAA
ncbi:TPA: FAD-binding oxidoreductase [Burkholderia aenigmatica]|uniref:NAD(P)/FAD-dependent oxidoreductase n=1 Tax=Burkholderia sp. AU45251 TaxID=3059204 RepID=UPI00264E909C|nr:FAD-binding oxidoreductase [Burkholderia sp. AU45251]HDR9482421.1 FAD-binding oxidoreductase [Burkholderia aenigmatica]MDN7514941.1 FAD-binding oxidoreductase [Burkholderia sp. AU45251]HDR9514727.1 FAD-binding oxidoreductase [Burkholderia aenigmatica]HDR9590792.1 FAD-binding oxidoreductase [Burkholderia aenigmatica]HDR9599948.1 FAD-binding oxidoreductase [Burkholderia aenigmatica]